MSTSTQLDPAKLVPWHVIFQTYSSHLLGLVVLCVVWFTMAKPIMMQNRLQWEQYQETLSTQRELATQMETTARILKDAADKIDEVCKGTRLIHSGE